MKLNSSHKLCTIFQSTGNKICNSVNNDNENKSQNRMQIRLCIRIIASMLLKNEAMKTVKFVWHFIDSVARVRDAKSSKIKCRCLGEFIQLLYITLQACTLTLIHSHTKRGNNVLPSLECKYSHIIFLTLNLFVLLLQFLVVVYNARFFAHYMHYM